jgi:hypothetical protein
MSQNNVKAKNSRRNQLSDCIFLMQTLYFVFNEFVWFDGSTGRDLIQAKISSKNKKSG